jgi:Family of unknown function (DUF5752)
MTSAAKPFDFYTVAALTRVGNQVATTLEELRAGLQNCSDASIFHHTFQTLGRHHFLTEGFSNDFAQWALTSANRSELAEQLGSLDVRDYLSIAELRSDLARIVGDYCAAHESIVTQSALEPFWFCEGLEVNAPLGHSASTLEEFRAGLELLNHAAFYFHFISSRMRLQLRTNDFSLWLANELELPALAERINRIDIYTNTLDGARAVMLRLIGRELAVA